MKIGLITFNRAYNYGAVLQCYALAKKLEEICGCCEVIDYQTAAFDKMYYYRTEFTLRHPGIRRRIERLTIRRILNKRNRRFENFIEKHVPLTTKMYRSWKRNEKIETDCDCYVTGSDQVWHNKWADFDPVFFLDFPDAYKKKRYSYAASFGMTELPTELEEEYRRRLTGFAAYSIRERSGTDIIKELTGKDAVVNCDPTLLLERSDWEELCDDIDASNDSYILIYYTSRSKALFDKAKQLAKEKRLKLISLPCCMDRKALSGELEKQYGFESVSSSGPVEFLRLFRDAEYVLTNTFHGTVFSLIFHKQFLTQMTNWNGTKNTRVAELFQEIGVTGRDMESNFENIDIAQDWNRIERNISQLRTNSLKYLSSITK